MDLTLLPDDDPLAQAVLDARRAGHRDSNDDEITTLREALELALERAGVTVRELTNDEIEEVEEGVSQVLQTVGVAQVRSEDLHPQLVVRRHDAGRRPMVWCRVWNVVSGDQGIDAVIRAGDGDPESTDEFSRWPFAMTRNAYTRLHFDDIAVILVIPNREDGGDSRDFHLVIADVHDLWDVQVLSPVEVRISGYQTEKLEG